MNLTRSNNWKMVKLGDIGKIVTGKTPSKDNPQDWGSDFDFVTPSDIVSSEKYLSTVSRKISETGFKRFKSMVIPAGSVMVTCIGSDMGKVVMNRKDSLTNQQINSIVIIDGFDKNYVYYSLKYLYPILRNNAGGGSTMPILNKSTFASLEISIPESLDEQKEIAGVLGCLDDKIELLRKENKTLEEMAQTLFKRWFVDFEFPNATGKMIDSELGKIPEGWRVGKLGEVLEIRGGTTPSTTNADFWNGDIHWTSPKDLSDRKDIFLLGTEKKITEEGLKEIGSGLLPKGTLLLSSRAPIGYLAISDIPLAINQGYIAILPNSMFSNFFAYLWIKEHMQDIIGAANGSTFLEISKTSFKNIDCVIPPNNVLENFTQAITPQFEKMRNNVLEINTLSKLRDELLSRIFSD